MNKKQRVLAAIHGETVDRPPIALWRHFPMADQDAAALARAHLDFQTRWDLDIIKVTEASGYPGDDWGARAEYRPNREGTRTALAYPVQSPRGWRGLPLLDARQGVLGRELQALRLTRAGAGPDIHILPTIFSPLSAAKYLARARLLDDLRHHPADLHAGLKTVAEVTARFAAACLDSGADAIFFATQFASLDALTEDEYAEFGEPYDRLVLDAVAGRAEFVLLHAHGARPMFRRLSNYPVQIINWHDRTTLPDLAGGQAVFAGAVAGGLDEWGALQQSPEAASAQARDAVRATAGRRFMLAAGCVIPIDTPDAHIQAVRQAVTEAVGA
jgi:uroporphyrinogen decarboxylase